MKKLICLVISVALILSVSTTAFAYTSGYAGISDYGNCPHGPRAGRQYVSNLQNSISTICTQSFMLTDTTSNKYVFQDDWAYDVDFFAYAGHGVLHENYNALHFRTIGTDATDHTEADHSDAAKLAKIEARTNEIRLGGTLKYATFYACNFLANSGSTSKQEEIYKMFEGARLAMGFASVMYLDSREGTRYGNNLKSGDTIVEAFINAAKRYQVQRPDGDAIARVVGYTSAASDTLTTATTVLPSYLWYTSYNNLYSIITTETIPHTGESLLW